MSDAIVWFATARATRSYCSRHKIEKISFDVGDSKNEKRERWVYKNPKVWWNPVSEAKLDALNPEYKKNKLSKLFFVNQLVISDEYEKFVISGSKDPDLEGKALSTLIVAVVSVDEFWKRLETLFPSK
jgi:hypothetical protein